MVVLDTQRNLDVNDNADRAKALSDQELILQSGMGHTIRAILPT